MHISIRALLAASVLYLLIPFCIFLTGWTHPLIALFFFVFLVYVITKNIKKVSGSIFISKKTLIVSGLFLFTWTLLSGTGHRGLQDGDAFKHSAILSDLISFDWPVTYKLVETNKFVYLVYYFAYYLPSAVIGKWLGWKAANIALFAWTYGGIAIAYTWLLSVVKEKTQIWISLLFPFFSGLDLIGRLMMWKRVSGYADWEWWGIIWQYSGNTTLFFYVPQHVIAGWICIGILVFSFLKDKKLPFQDLLFVSTLLWSPFVFIGLAPFYAWMFIRKKCPIKITTVALSLFILAIEILFFLSNMTLSVRETTASAWLWQIEKLFGSKILFRLGMFYLLEFGIFAAFLIRAKKRSSLLFLAFAILLLIPWYKMGLMNDFAMRASIPALFVVGIYWLTYLVETKKSIFMTIVVALLFLIGCAYPFVLMRSGIVHFSFGPPRFSVVQLDDPKIRRQYLGNSNTPFFNLFNPKIVQQKKGKLTLLK
ncbi:MAG: hypothetical protein NTZ55_00420 [Candidatus Roizmanbacteria bacterium]|nr:hypothetical protein [Candidatus Roizmanbacteria bacterium]